MDEAAAGTEVYVAAVRPSVSDTKTYVTTVEEGEIGSLIQRYFRLLALI